MVCKICGSEIPENVGFCPNCGAEIEKKVQDIPLQDAPEDAFDPEDGTTVLTEGMSGPLVADQFVKKPREHQPQSPEGKVVTPAPVTGSSILSDDSVVPSGKPQAPATQAPQGAPVQPQAAPQKPQVQPQAVPPKAPQGVQPQAVPPKAPQAAPQQPKPQFAPQPQQQMPRPVTPAQTGGSTISALGYFGYMLLFSIPLVGFIIAIVFAVSHKNKNVKNFAIGWLFMLLFVIVINVILFFVFRAMGIDIMEDVLFDLW